MVEPFDGGMLPRSDDGSEVSSAKRSHVGVSQIAKTAFSVDRVIVRAATQPGGSRSHQWGLQMRPVQSGAAESLRAN